VSFTQTLESSYLEGAIAAAYGAACADDECIPLPTTCLHVCPGGQPATKHCAGGGVPTTKGCAGGGVPTTKFCGWGGVPTTKWCPPPECQELPKTCPGGQANTKDI
jgi:hypothetical protein